MSAVKLDVGHRGAEGGAHFLNCKTWKEWDQKHPSMYDLTRVEPYKGGV